jgi:hypothetical protein
MHGHILVVFFAGAEKIPDYSAACPQFHAIPPF